MMMRSVTATPCSNRTDPDPLPVLRSEAYETTEYEIPPEVELDLGAWGSAVDFDYEEISDNSDIDIDMI